MWINTSSEPILGLWNFTVNLEMSVDLLKKIRDMQIWVFTLYL